ncbi:MAG: type II secretion system protein [Phycisphaerales bacterium]
MTSRTHTRAFTLIEILIVVVILGILAAIVIPQFSALTGDAQAKTTYSEVQKLRRHLGVFKARNSNNLPNVLPGNGTWGELVAVGGEYLLEPPVNQWVGGNNSHVIVLGNTPDTTFHTNYGWIYDPATGDVWAASFDAADHPLPRP